ncbi:response regulator [Chitinibacter bivalviorum]|uniref:Response regulator n=1 Tax=Chitinibacter bivalviorum TaxID=2739434 RepID=A0A7H9BL86_9NEIS|nr:response regulator [Chitinibacter bivalviorum]QLG89106.1 response regulator [Chitinibacter bivalviorum]
MTQRRSFAITLLGLSESEVRLVKSICALTASRARSYHIQEDLQKKADIYIANAESNAVLDILRRLNRHNQMPVIYVSRTEIEQGEYRLKRPMLPTTLLKLLETVTITAHNFTPELAQLGAADLQGNNPESNRLINQVLSSNAPKQCFRALIVDDSPTVRKQLELFLKLLGGDIDCAETGEAGIALAQQNEYDMIFLDVVLPNADGYQVCRTIRKNRDTKHTPIIMLTSKSSPFDRVRGTLAGCSTYLTKPVESAVFKEVVQKYLPQAVVSDDFAAA